MWGNKHNRFIGGLYNVQTEFSENKVYCLLIKSIRALPEIEKFIIIFIIHFLSKNISVVMGKT